ncbi:hypothetical protein [Saccharopolyspora sp. 5N708]|uniref:hypothetical protein n=1 Tax=Saccharopolyspora sp. 5N708 TaxID=3457424 RepID=UPI003FCFCFD7
MAEAVESPVDVNHAIVSERDDEDGTWITEGRHRLTAMFETGTRCTGAVRTASSTPTPAPEQLGAE